VVAALKLHLLSTNPHGSDELRTGNIEAYNQYLRGKESFNHGDQDGYRRAVKAFSAATALIQATQRLMPAWHWPIFWMADATMTLAGYETRLRLQTRPSLSLQDWPPAMRSGFLRAAYRFDTSGARATWIGPWRCSRATRGAAPVCHHARNGRRPARRYRPREECPRAGSAFCGDLYAP